MAKKKQAGLALKGGVYTCRTIAIDGKGTPWLIDPERGTIGLVTFNASMIVTDIKQSAVKKRRK